MYSHSWREKNSHIYKKNLGLQEEMDEKVKYMNPFIFSSFPLKFCAQTNHPLNLDPEDISANFFKTLFYYISADIFWLYI